MTAIGHHGRLLAVRPRRPRVAAAELARPLRHAVIALLASGVVLAVVLTRPTVTTTGSEGELRASSVSATTTVSGTAVRAMLVERLSEARTHRDAAEALLTSSQGHVLDETARSGLGRAVQAADVAILAAERRLVWPVSSLTGRTAEGDDLAVALTASAAPLDAGMTAVGHAVEAWEAEQARIAAEQEAARRAAEAAALASRSAPRAVVPASAGASVFTEWIWTSGGQAEIDACRGSVNVPQIAGYLGGAFYAAEHWSCGGRAWGGVGVGATVEFPGYGVYQVAGRVGGLAYGSDASAVPAGYAGYYQTCIGGSASNMTVWLLTRIG